MVLAANEILVMIDADRGARPCGTSSRTLASLMIGFMKVFLCISGLAFTSVRLIHCKIGSSLKAKG